MSAAPTMVWDTASRRAIPRRPLYVPLDVIALRSGVPENLPGRCTDLSENGVGAIVAGTLIPGQQVAVEFRLPNVGVPVRSRALVRYQQRLHCGLQFVGLTPEERETIRYWAGRVPAKPGALPKTDEFPAMEIPVKADAVGSEIGKSKVRWRRFYALLGLMLCVVAFGWWQWQRSWTELEAKAAITPERGSPLKVSQEIMAKRITSKTDPAYPERARRAGAQGMVVLDAVIGADGTVKQLTPVSGPEPLVQSATAAVESWKFEPYRLDGKPAEVETTISVEFRLR